MTEAAVALTFMTCPWAHLYLLLEGALHGGRGSTHHVQAVGHLLHQPLQRGQQTITLLTLHRLCKCGWQFE